MQKNDLRIFSEKKKLKRQKIHKNQKNPKIWILLYLTQRFNFSRDFYEFL